MNEESGVESSKAARSMTVQVMKTRTEAALSEQFAAAEAALPGGKRVRRLRREAIGVFSALGLPHRRIEEWKYTDLRALLKVAYPIARAHAADGAAAADGMVPLLAGAAEVAFVDHTLTVLGTLPAGVSVSPLSTLLAEEPAWLIADIERVASAQGEAMIALNTAMMGEGAVVTVRAGTAVGEPLHLVFRPGRGGPAAACLRNIVHVERGASVVLVESYAASTAALRQRNVVTQIEVGEGARVVHVQYVGGRIGSAHIGSLLVRIGAGATYNPFLMTLGSGLVRNDIRAGFAAEGATFELGCAFLLDHESHADTTLVVDHAVPACTSRELVKGVLEDRARGVFQGKVIVRPGAQKSDGKQMAQALMLSPEAEFDSKPELEIFADDVVCGHGSTSAEIDEDLLFYCCARGIPREEAKALLVESFIGEAVDKVAHEGVREALMALVRGWLKRDHARPRAA
jgi:Fe-S cluster assembly protein SufD